MKPVISALRLNQKVWALVEEVLSSSSVIVNLGGDLMRVRNESQRTLRVGQRIQLKVAGIEPLQFQLVEARSSSGIAVPHIDVEV